MPSTLSKDDSTKILTIKKGTAIVGGLFFGHVDCVSRRLFDLSPIQEKFNSPPITSRPFKKVSKKIHALSFSLSFISTEIIEDKKLLEIKTWFMLLSCWLVSPNLSFSQHQHIHNIVNFIMIKIDWQNQLIYQALRKNRFIKAKWNRNIDDYEILWRQCLWPIREMASKIEKFAVEPININLSDYITNYSLFSRHGWVVTLFDTYPRSTVFKLQYHYP